MTLIWGLHVYAQALLQAVVIFVPVVIFVVIFSSDSFYSDWTACLDQYHTGNNVFKIHTWGAGDYLSTLVDSAVVALAFASVDAFINYIDLIPAIVVLVGVVALMIIVAAAVLALVLQSPSIIALPLLTRFITTAVAISLAPLTGANTGIIAASTIINAVMSYRTAPYVLDFYRIRNPVARGVGVAMSGTLLGVLAMDEAGEPIAAGVGMVGFGIATIWYSIWLAIAPLRDAFVAIA